MDKKSSPLLAFLTFMYVVGTALFLAGIAAYFVKLFAVELPRWIEDWLILYPELPKFAIGVGLVMELVGHIGKKILTAKINEAEENTEKAATPAHFHGSMNGEMNVDWSPIVSGGSNFKTSELKKIASHRMEFGPSAGAFMFVGVFFLFMIIFAGVSLGNFDDMGALSIPFLLVPALMFGGVLFLTKKLFQPVVFDKRLGWFWKGDKKLTGTRDIEPLPDSCQLSQIAALQIIEEDCSGDDSHYSSYELNLVLKDGRRLNVIDHGNEDAVRDDAKTIADFLGVKVLTKD